MRADIRVLFVQPTLAALAEAVGRDSEIQVPANLIDAHCQHITPELLPLVALDQAAIDRIVAQVPGGPPMCRISIRWAPCRPAFFITT